MGLFDSLVIIRPASMVIERPRYKCHAGTAGLPQVMPRGTNRLLSIQGGSFAGDVVSDRERGGLGSVLVHLSALRPAVGKFHVHWNYLGTYLGR